MKYFRMILACFALNVLFHHSIGVQGDNSEIVQRLVRAVSKLNSYHPGMDAFTFTPDQFIFTLSDIPTSAYYEIDDLQIRFNNFKMSEQTLYYNSARYTTSLGISNGKVVLNVSLPCNFEIEATVNISDSEAIQYSKIIKATLGEIGFSKPLTIAENGSILENDEAPQVTINKIKICAETHTEFGPIISEATENLIDKIKKKMEIIWLKQFEQQLNKTRNYFPMNESEFSNELDLQRDRNPSDVLNITEEIISLKEFGIETRSISIEGLLNLGKLKMTVTKDANTQDDGSWSYHCARTQAQIETNKLKGRLEWNFKDKPLKRNSFIFHLNYNFVLEKTENINSGYYIYLKELKIDPFNNYKRVCGKELLQHIFAENLKLFISTQLNNLVESIVGDNINSDPEMDQSD